MRSGSVSGSDFERTEVLGYATIVLSFVLVFLGIRSYRENVGGGTISFGRAFAVGILITLISCLMYVISWEIIYYNFTPDFADKYAARTLEQLREKGASAAEISEQEQRLAAFKKMYANPVMNALITLMEPLPIGLVLTLLSAAILRRKPVLSGA